jgi:hypothetical protein
MAASGQTKAHMAHPVQPSLKICAGWYPFGVRRNLSRAITSGGQAETHTSQPLQYRSLTSIQPLAGIDLASLIRNYLNFVEISACIIMAASEKYG